MKHYLLDGKTPVLADGLVEWAVAFSTHSRVVSNTKIKDGVRVSTVFLGLDHSFGRGPALLFETMIFGGTQDGFQARCSTWEQAEAQHAAVVSLLNHVEPA